MFRLPLIVFFSIYQLTQPNPKVVSFFIASMGRNHERSRVLAAAPLPFTMSSPVSTAEQKDSRKLMRSKSGGGNACRRSCNDSVEGRKSLSHLEIKVSDVASLLKIRVMAVDMPELMQVQAFRSARRAYGSLDKFSTRQIAQDIKKEFDKVYGPTWHCIVGTSFGSFVTHSTGCFVYFAMEKVLIMLFKTKIHGVLVH